MKVFSSAAAILASLPRQSLAQTQECVPGAFTLEIDGSCTPDAVVDAYDAQVFGATGQADSPCGHDAASDIAAKLSLAGLDLAGLCKKVYDDQNQVPFYEAFKRGTDLHFEQEFYNGHTDWQEEVETRYETDDLTRTSVLKEDAELVRAFHDGTSQGKRVAWPGILPNFHSSATDSDGNPTCETSAMMCCWPKDRQANDGNGNCASDNNQGGTYDEDCVDKDPADNTDLCYVDTKRGNQSTGIEGDDMIVFPGDNGQGEGQIHCHGMAWGNDVNDHTARYKANNLFYVSAYDHMYVRGYVKNIPGAPMCGCVEQMPTVSRSDCTQVDLTEKIEIKYSADSTVTTRFTEVHVDFNACKGINNRNNDLYAYMGRLYYEKKVTAEQWGTLGRIITDNGCTSATKYELDKRGLTAGYDHDTDQFTNVAGREGMKIHDGYGHRAFNKSLRPGDRPSAENPHHGIIYRVCGDCDPSHKKIFYRRRTEVPDDYALNWNLMYQTNNGNGRNVYLTDFTLHSTLEDALEDRDPWQCPDRNGNKVEDAGDFNHGAPFYGECSPNGNRVRNQRSLFQNSGDKHDVAYYIYKSEDEGLEMLQSAAIKGRYIAAGTVLRDNDNGDIFMNSWGNDIWNWNAYGTTFYDDFHYYSQPAEGDHTVIAKAHQRSTISGPGHWQKSGVMIRKSLEPGSAHFSLLLTPGGGICLQYRPTDGDRTHSYHCQRQGVIEAWLKVEKRMDDYTAFMGDENADGDVEWTKIYTYTLPNIGESYTVGLASTSAGHGYPVEVVFSGYEVDQYYFPSAAPSISAAPTGYVESSDINNPNVAGSAATTATGDIIVRGAGSDIWNSRDQFHYAHFNPKSGNVRAELKVLSFENNYSWSKAGIMVRQSLEPGSPHNSLLLSGSNGLSNMFRSGLNGGTGHSTDYGLKSKPIWLRIDKIGDVFSTYYKYADDDEWTLKWTRTMALGESFYVGVAVTSHLTSCPDPANVAECDSYRIATLRGTGWTVTEGITETQAATRNLRTAEN